MSTLPFERRPFPYLIHESFLKGILASGFEKHIKTDLQNDYNLDTYSEM